MPENIQIRFKIKSHNIVNQTLPIDSNLLAKFTETACLAADQARMVTQKWFRSDFVIRSKQDRSPITIADQETEDTLCRTILQRHPDHDFMGEETGRVGTDHEWLWVIDPIDGTKSFATGKPFFGTLIAVLFKGRPVIGVIDHVALNERWVGVAGMATTYNGKVCQTRRTDCLADATLCITTIDMFDAKGIKRVDALTNRCRFRVFGGDCYNYGLLSSGFTDLVCEASLKPYDYIALVPVVEGAGGVITDWQGKALSLGSGGDVVAAGSKILHRLALAALEVPA